MLADRQAHRQTDRQTDTVITILCFPIRGRVITVRTPTGTEWCFLRAPFRWKAAKQEAQNLSQHSMQFYNTHHNITNNSLGCKFSGNLILGEKFSEIYRKIYYAWMQSARIQAVWLMTIITTRCFANNSNYYVVRNKLIKALEYTMCTLWLKKLLLSFFVFLLFMFATLHLPHMVDNDDKLRWKENVQ